jgi:hypothetical protein
MSEEKREEEIAPSMNPEERPNLQDYKSKDKVTPSATGKKTDFTSVTTVPTPEGDVQAETELEIPLENDKENVKSEKPPKVKHCQKKNLPLQQFLRKSFQKGQLKCNKVMPQNPNVL